MSGAATYANLLRRLTQTSQVATSLLLLLLGGPLRAATYVLLHGACLSSLAPRLRRLTPWVRRLGSLGVALGMLWLHKCSWLVSIPCTAAFRCAGVFGSLAVSSLLLRENVLALIAAQMYAILDQMSAAIGLSATPEFSWVYLLASVLVLVNSLSYCTLLHLLYSLVLGRTGGRDGGMEAFGNTPLFVRRAFMQD